MAKTVMDKLRQFVYEVSMPRSYGLSKEIDALLNELNSIPRDCGHCKFYVTPRCHRLPPTEEGKWPITSSSDWCGEIKIKGY
jgi:hypothetical protein